MKPTHASRSLWFLVLVCASCTSTQEKQEAAFYGPTESFLEVISVLRRHVPDDTYRFDPATDFTGRNVYRGTLLRLENLEQIHSSALESGYLTHVVDFAKARALERLRAYDLAAQHYARIAAREGTLQAAASEAAPFCEAIARAVEIGNDIVDPLAPSTEPLSLDTDGVVAALDERVRQLSALHERAPETHYRVIVREELERADVTRARYFVAVRSVIPNGHIRAVSELQRVVGRNAPSKLRRRHTVELANLYVALAEEYVASTPPASLRFDPPRFQELVEAASQLYQAVATQDGTVEKLEASRRLEAFLAFVLTVDRDRFSQ